MYDGLIFSFVHMFHLSHFISRGVSIISASGGLHQAIFFICTYQDESTFAERGSTWLFVISAFRTLLMVERVGFDVKDYWHC